MSPKHLPSVIELAPSTGASGRCLVWRFERPMRSVSSAIVGGGIGEAAWVLNMTVDSDYGRLDPAEHLQECATRLGLSAAGIGLMTAVDVAAHSTETVDGATVTTTVGVRRPVWASAAHAPSRSIDPASAAARPGTINVVATVPVTLSDAALVNAVATITEAKVQALLDDGIDGTGTASDAVCVMCPATTDPATSDTVEAFGGPRSTWGGRLADATYASIRAGIARQRS